MAAHRGGSDDYERFRRQLEREAAREQAAREREAQRHKVPRRRVLRNAEGTQRPRGQPGDGSGPPDSCVGTPAVTVSS